jgi:hypothetical protein
VLGRNKPRPARFASAPLAGGYAVIDHQARNAKARLSIRGMSLSWPSSKSRELYLDSASQDKYLYFPLAKYLDIYDNECVVE